MIHSSFPPNVLASADSSFAENIAILPTAIQIVFLIAGVLSLTILISVIIVQVKKNPQNHKMIAGIVIAVVLIMFAILIKGI